MIRTSSILRRFELVSYTVFTHFASVFHDASTGGLLETLDYGYRVLYRNIEKNLSGDKFLVFIEKVAYYEALSIVYSLLFCDIRVG